MSVHKVSKKRKMIKESDGFNIVQRSNKINEAHLYDINRTSSDYVDLMNERGLEGHMLLFDDSTIITDKGKLNIGLVNLDDLDDKSLVVIPAYDFQWAGPCAEADEVYDLFLNEDYFDDIEGVINSLVQMQSISEVRDFFNSIVNESKSVELKSKTSDYSFKMNSWSYGKIDFPFSALVKYTGSLNDAHGNYYPATVVGYYKNGRVYDNTYIDSLKNMFKTGSPIIFYIKFANKKQTYDMSDCKQIRRYDDLCRRLDRIS